jgi:hypothetical protein
LIHSFTVGPFAYPCRAMKSAKQAGRRSCPAVVQ